jgi:quercetin dioxygenase-like cupin family protein
VNYSRRDLSVLLPALMAATATAAEPATLPSKAFVFEDLPVRNTGTANHSRAMLNGLTHSGFPVEMHQTELAPGSEPHPPHHHVHEEMILVREGTMEVTISGKVTKIGPGGAAYVASGEEHGWRNVGTTNAHYFIIALGQGKP